MKRGEIGGRLFMLGDLPSLNDREKFSIQNPQKSFFEVRLSQKNPPINFRKCNISVEFYTKYTVFSSNEAKLRSFELLRTKKGPFCTSNYRFFTGHWAFLCPDLVTGF